jgi:hypothetical protein
MAYNREWDKGKDQWSDNTAWNATDPRTNVRGREEDYYGEGKRRKFNGGVSASALRENLSITFVQGYQGYDNAQAYDEGASYAQQGPPQDDRTQQRAAPAGAFPKKRLTPSDPSPHVIFLGLDQDFTEADVC